VVHIKGALQLQEAIDEHFTYLSSGWAGKDHPFYRDGERFYMRPWYYINWLEFRINDTSRITAKVLGDDLNATHCWPLSGNAKLFRYDPDRDDLKDYIYSQDFVWLLSTIGTHAANELT
jgi:hypothetical protein